MLEQLMCNFLLVLGKYVNSYESFSTVSRKRLCVVVFYGILSLGAPISPKIARDRGKITFKITKALL
jgi:hypothetical protein